MVVKKEKVAKRGAGDEECEEGGAEEGVEGKDGGGEEEGAEGVAEEGVKGKDGLEEEEGAEEEESEEEGKGGEKVQKKV